MSSHQWVLYRVSLFYGARGLYPFCVPHEEEILCHRRVKRKGDSATWERALFERMKGDYFLETNWRVCSATCSGVMSVF